MHRTWCRVRFAARLVGAAELRLERGAKCAVPINALLELPPQGLHRAQLDLKRLRPVAVGKQRDTPEGVYRDFFLRGVQQLPSDLHMASS